MVRDIGTGRTGMARGQGRGRVDAKGPLCGKVDRAMRPAGGQTAFSKERNRFSQKSCQGHGEVGGLFLDSKEQEGEGPRGAGFAVLSGYL